MKNALKEGLWLMCALALLIAASPAGLHAEVIKREGALITVRETAQAELGEGTKKGVKEKAKLIAIRKVIEEYAGVHISSRSTMKNFVMEKDVVNAYQNAYFKSVKEISYTYDKAKELGIYVGEFVLDLAATKKLADSERRQEANKNKPVGASVFLFDGDGKMMSDGAIVRAGDQFNILVQPVSDLYGYIISRDSRGNLFNVFPNPDIAPHQNPLQAGVKYYFPPRDSEINLAFDDNPGRERIYFLLSAGPLEDIDSLFESMAAMQTEAEKKAIASILEERVAKRGIALQSKETKGTVMLSKGQGRKTERRIGQLLKGTGAFVKTIVLNHVE